MTLLVWSLVGHAFSIAALRHKGGPLGWRDVGVSYLVVLLWPLWALFELYDWKHMQGGKP